MSDVVKYIFQHLDTQIHPKTKELYLFGRCKDGKSIAVLVKDVQPHFVVKGSLDRVKFLEALHKYHFSNIFFRERKKKKVTTVINPSYHRENILKVRFEKLTGQDVCDYSEDGEQEFTKLTFSNAWILREAKRLLTETVKICYHGDMTCKTMSIYDALTKKEQEYTYGKHCICNDQVDVGLQWLIDKDLYSCGFFEVVGRQCEVVTTCNIEVEAERVTQVKDDGMVPWKILSYDIETLSRVRENGTVEFPSPDQDPIITISVVLQGTKTTQHVWILRDYKEEGVFDSLRRLDDDPDFDPKDCNVYNFDSEAKLLQDFVLFIVQEDVDFLEGHNISRFDNDFVLKRYKKYFGSCNLGRFRQIKSYISKKVFFSKQKGKTEQFRFYVPGRVIFDSYDIMKDQHNENSYSLNNLAAKFLGTKKVDMPYDDIPKHYKTTEGRHRLAVYCLKDSFLVREMMKKLCKITVYVQMASVTGISIKDVIERGQGIRTLSLMLRFAKKRNFFIPRKEAKKKKYQKRNVLNGTSFNSVVEEVVEEEGFQGAVVVEPSKGFYSDPAICLDFASLYPSIMQAMNMSYDTIVTQETVDRMSWKEEEEYRRVPEYDYVDGVLKTRSTPKDILFVTTKVRLGLLPEILKTVLAERKAVKKLMKGVGDPSNVLYQVYNGRQLGLKVVANSIYGFTGASVGFLPEKRIASSVTKFGRGMILSTKSFIENHEVWGKQHHLKVIYGDTDSVFVHIKRSMVDGATEAEIVEKCHTLGEAMAQEINPIFLPPNDLEYEKTYYPYLLVKKKRYAGKKFEPGLPPKMHIKGLESVRRDYAPVLVEAQKKILAYLLDITLKDPIQKVKDYIATLIENINTNSLDIQKLIITKKLSKKPEEYENKSAHVNLALRLQKENPYTAPMSGDRVPYLIYCGVGKQSNRACTPEEVKSGKFVVDRQYYLEKQLKNPLCRILEAFMTPKEAAFLFQTTVVVKDRIHESNKMFAAFKRSPKPKRKFTVSVTKSEKKYKTTSMRQFFK